MLTNRANLMMDAFDDQLVTATEVNAWAESELAGIQDPASVPAWLLDLLRDGPVRFLHSSHAWRVRAGFKVRFALHATHVDLADRDSVRSFMHWVARAVFREDPDEPEATFGYVVDHYLSDMEDEALAIQYIHEKLPNLLPDCQATLETIRG